MVICILGYINYAYYVFFFFKIRWKNVKYKLIWKFGQNHLLLNLRKIVYPTWKNYGLKNIEGIF